MHEMCEKPIVASRARCAAAGMLAAGLLVLAGPAAAQSTGAAQAGVAAAVRGDVRLVALAAVPATPGPGVGRVVASGDRIFLGDKIATGPQAGLQIMLLDETIFTIGPNAEMVIDTFVYDPSSDAGEVTASIIKGAFRFVSGRIAKRNPSDMSVRLPVATIGIRGTSVAGEVVPATPTSPPSAEIILLGPGGDNNADERAGRVVVDNAGTSIEISRPGFGTTINGVQAPPTLPVRVPPARISALGGDLGSTGGTGDGSNNGAGDSSSGDQGNADSDTSGSGQQADSTDGAADSDGTTGESGASAGDAAPGDASQGSGEPEGPGPGSVTTVTGPGGGGTTFAAGGSIGGGTALGSGTVPPPTAPVVLPSLGTLSGLTLGLSIETVGDFSAGQNTTSETDEQTTESAVVTQVQLSQITTFQQLVNGNVTGLGTYTLNNVPLVRISSPNHPMTNQPLTASGHFDARVDADFGNKTLKLVVNNVSYDYETAIFGQVIQQNGNTFTFDSDAQNVNGRFDENSYLGETGNVERTWNSSIDANNFPVVAAEPLTGTQHVVEVSGQILNNPATGEIASAAQAAVKISITHSAANEQTVLAGGATAPRQ